MKKILVPTDFSECAQAATQVAIAIAQKTGAEIYFLHLLSDPFGDSHVPHSESPQKLPDERNAKIGQVRSALETLVAEAIRVGVKATQELVLGRGGERIEDYLKPYGIDLVVMGSHGVWGLREAFIGSKTQHFIRHSSVPVLVVKKKPEKFEIENIVFASDFKEDFIKPFEAIITLSRIWNAKLQLLYVNTPYYFRETSDVISDIKRFMHQFRGINYASHIYNATDEERGIHQFIKVNKADLIALTTHGRTGFLRMITHSIAESLVNHEEIPILVVNVGLKNPA